MHIWTVSPTEGLTKRELQGHLLCTPAISGLQCANLWNRKKMYPQWMSFKTKFFMWTMETLSRSRTVEGKLFKRTQLQRQPFFLDYVTMNTAPSEILSSRAALIFIPVIFLLYFAGEKSSKIFMLIVKPHQAFFVNTISHKIMKEVHYWKCDQKWMGRVEHKNWFDCKIFIIELHLTAKGRSSFYLFMDYPLLKYSEIINVHYVLYILFRAFFLLFLVS